MIANKEEVIYSMKNSSLGDKLNFQTKVQWKVKKRKPNTVTHLVVNGSGYIQMSLAANHSFIITPQQL